MHQIYFNHSPVQMNFYRIPLVLLSFIAYNACPLHASGIMDTDSVWFDSITNIRTHLQSQDTLAPYTCSLHFFGKKPNGTPKNPALQALVEDLALRAMAKARYSTHNIGHYGLMFRHYTHFTSPIRRYPDQMVHRLLTRYLDGGRSVNQLKIEEQCDHSSEMEQIAANAERASIKYKQVEYMADKLGQEFEGKVSGITEFGIYVQLNESKCEGLVMMHTLTDDHYSYDPDTLSAVGRRTHRRINLGDPARIKVAAANIEKRQLDFQLLEINRHECM